MEKKDCRQCIVQEAYERLRITFNPYDPSTRLPRKLDKLVEECARRCHESKPTDTGDTNGS